jgi:superkiller protein 3
MYQRVIDWTDQMETRRLYESKLLRRASETLMVCSAEEKENRRDTVWRIAHGMVALNLPDELAWTICVDWRDFEAIGKPTTRWSRQSNNAELYGKVFLEDLIRSVPKSGLAKVLSAYLASELSRFPPDEKEPCEGDEELPQDGIRIPPEEILDDMIVPPGLPHS